MKKIQYIITLIIFGQIFSFSANGDASKSNVTSSVNQSESSNNIRDEPIPLAADLTTSKMADSSASPPSQTSNVLLPHSCITVEDNVFECTTPGGHLVIQTNKKGITTYNFKLEDEEEGMLHFSKDNLSYLGEDCSITIADNIYNDIDLLKKNNIYLFNVSISLVVINEYPDCSFKFFYSIALPYVASAQLTDVKGSIESPIDIDGLQSYRPLTTFIWYIQPDLSNCFIELDIKTFDLGSIANEIISTEMDLSPSQYDFLSIGLDINETNTFGVDYIFFGKLSTPVTEMLPSCSAKVTFTSKMHFQDALGFRIEYRVIDTTESDENTELTSGLSTWIAINGAIINRDEGIKDLYPKIKQVIAEMANNYLSLNYIDKNVSEENVTIHEVGACSIFYCQLDCMTFFFSVDLYNDDNEPIFTTDTLNYMIDNAEVTVISASFQICHKTPYVNWSYPIFFLLLVMVCSFTIIILSICESDNAYNEKRRNNLKYIISDWETPWKRQSFSDISISSASSQTPFVKKRFYFPLFRSRSKTNQSHSPTYEVTEFKEFKSKPVDSNDIGLNEVIPHSQTNKSNEFCNNAFTEDEEIYNKYSTPSTLNPDMPNISAQQSFQDANPFRDQMIRNGNYTYGTNN